MADKFILGFPISDKTADSVLYQDGSNVGIGTTTPGYKLDVNGSFHSTNINIADAIYHEGNTNNYIQFGTNSQNFVTNGSHRLNIKSDGNVGIGTTSPDVKLEVVDASPTDGIIADFVNSTNSGGTTAAIKLSNADSENCDVVLGANRVGANFGSDFFISLSDSVDGSNQERFRITEAGNVGIGTTSPSKKLHINSGSTNDVALFESTDSFANIYIKDNSGEMSIQKVGTDVLILTQTSSTHGNLRFLSNSGSERMRITSSGNVGIGTTSPSAKLQVVASSGQEGIIINNSNGIQTFQLGHLTSNDSYFQMKNNSDVTEVLFRTDNGDSYINTGNVGIGTTSPSTKLEVNGITTSDAFRTKSSSENYSIITRNSSGNAVLYVQSANDATNQPIAKFIYGNTSPNQGSVVLNVAKDKSYFSNTDVGIGTTSPSEKLHVVGEVKATGGFTYASGATAPTRQSGSTGLQFWSGTKAQYTALTKDSNTIYYVTDE